MNDTRLDRVGELVTAAEFETDEVVQGLLLVEAIREYSGFADEFPDRDTQIRVVAVRLAVALRAVHLGDWRSASTSLSLAGGEIQVVKNR